MSEHQPPPPPAQKPAIGKYLLISRQAALDCQEAARTLGAMLYFSGSDSRPVFANIPKIALLAGVSLSTAKRHLETLVTANYLAPPVHDIAKNGKLRKAATYNLAKPRDEILKEHFRLPLWATAVLKEWSHALVYSLLCWRANSQEFGTLADPE